MSEFLHIVCPECQATNRVPNSRLLQHPKCGRCQEDLFKGEPVALHESNFDIFLNRNDIPVLVDFWADWCGPCQMMAPAFKQAAQILEPKVRLAKVNTENAPGISARYGIRSIPTLMLFHKGLEKSRQAGAMGTQAIINWVQHHQ